MTSSLLAPPYSPLPPSQPLLSSSHHNSCAIALFETHFDHDRLREFASLTEEPDEFGSNEEDPQPCTTADEYGPAEPEGMVISKVKFEEMKKTLPSLTRSVQGEILWEVSLAVRFAEGGVLIGFFGGVVEAA